MFEIVISCIVCFAIAFGIILSIVLKNKYEKIVIENSKKYNKLISINKKYNFYDDLKDYNFDLRCNSKRQLDNLILYDMLKSEIENCFYFIKDLIIKVEENKKNLKSYKKEVFKIKSTITQDKAKELKIGYKTFLKIEERMFNSKILKPRIDFNIRCYAYYISPKGRNHYSKENTYNYNQIVNALDEIDKQIQFKQTRQYQIKIERAKVSDSLRYDVFKRDNFKCQICGATKNDGVILHVDHIVPVSKGGTSNIANLRTLCSRCNLGKSDKLE